MATFGIYQVLDPLYVTSSGSVNSAKIVGGDAAGRIVVKLFSAPKSGDTDEPNWEPRYFLDRAQVQRRVAATGGAHWAPIYALGFTPEGGAYYVTDYHALTGRKMIDGHVPLDATALHAIIRSVVSGLEEIRKIAGRAHGNLKASNVLLVGKGPADELRAVLCDPGQEYTAEKDGEAGDLKALGALIHELVLNRLPGGTDFATPGDPGWNKLGDKGEAWRQLCADLLVHPIAPRASTLSSVGKIVDGLAPPRLKVPHIRLPGKSKSAGKTKITRPATPRGPSKFKRRFVQVAALVTLAGGTVAVMGVLESNARQEVCTAKKSWLGSLATSLTEPQRRELFNSDPHLKRIAEGVDNVERAGIECPPDGEDSRFNPLGFLQVMKSRNAAAALRNVEQELAPESWPQLAKLRDLAKTFEQRGWQQPAGYVNRLLEGVRPMPAVTATLASRPSTGPDALQPAAGSLAQRIDRVLRLRPIIEDQAAASYEDWKQLDERTAALAASPDPVIAGIGAFLKREAVAGMKLTDEGFDGLVALKQHANTAGRVVETLRVAPPTAIDNVRFDEQVASGINPAEPTMVDVNRWLTRRPEFVIKREKITETYDALQKGYDATVADVAKSEPDKTERAAFEQEQKDVEAALREFRLAPFIQQDIADGRFDAKVVEINAQIKNLKRYYHAEDAADWLENLPGIAATSERMRARWDAWVQTLRTDLKAMTADRELFAKNKARTDKLRDLMQDLELSFPQPPEGLTDSFAAAAKQRREDRIGKLLDDVSATNPELKPDVLKDAADGMTGWFADLVELNKDFPVKKKTFTLADKPDEKWRKREQFWTDAAIVRLVRPDVERLERLRKIAGAPRADLVKLATDDTVRDEVNVTAWQLLGDGRINPAWPATADEIQTETALRSRVSSKLAQMDPAERKDPQAVFDSEGPRRWRRFVESADSEAMLLAALARRKAFGVEASVLGEMPPEARFNVWLCLANSAIKSNSDTKPGAAAPAAKPDQNAEDFDKIVDNLVVAARQLPEPKASQVLDKLSKLEVPEPFASSNLGAVFAMKVDGVDDPIEFRRVEPSDGSRPFYLATREVSVAQFAGAMDGKKLWDEARKLAWPYRPEKGDGRRGARTWEWVNLQSPRIGVPQLWMTKDDANKHNDFPRDFRPDPKFNRNALLPAMGGMPSAKHPMQYVSAQAALYYAAALECRLPTSTEWRQALDATATTGGKPPQGNWNLRDQQTWDAFRDYATKEGIAFEHWPDRGAFHGEPAGAPRSRPGNDGVMLYRPVPPADQAFHDLVGNVAEFVLEQPDAFARWRDKSSAEDIRNFLTDTPDAVAVIGGSAVSAADTPIDKPVRADRTDRAYSDVGFRLAFTAPSRTPAERLKWVLAGEDYVWPRSASAAAAQAR